MSKSFHRWLFSFICTIAFLGANATAAVLQASGPLRAADSPADVSLSATPTLLSFSALTFGAPPLDGSIGSYTPPGSPLTFLTPTSTLFAATGAISTLDEASGLDLLSLLNPMKALTLSIGLFMADGITPIGGDLFFTATSNASQVLNFSLSLTASGQPQTLAFDSTDPLVQIESLSFSTPTSGAFISIFNVDADFLHPVIIPVSTVPTPSTGWLLGLAALGLSLTRKRYQPAD